MAYLPSTDPFAELKALLIAPSAYVDEIESLEPGWVAGQLEFLSRWIDARLRKRYAAPFAEPYPVVLQGWLAALMDPLIYQKRGIDPTDLQLTTIVERRDNALLEIKEAADAVDGLFDLPLRNDTTATGIAKGAPLGYSEVSPYSWSHNQRESALDE